MIGGITGGERGINRHERTRTLQCTRTFPAKFGGSIQTGSHVFARARSDYLWTKERSDRLPAKQAPDCTQHAMPVMLNILQ